jgi:putative ABC transport system substrate-binding protein
MKRRRFLCGSAAFLALAGPGHAQQAEKVHRIGVLGIRPTSPTTDTEAIVQMIRGAMRDSGVVEAHADVRAFWEADTRRLPDSAAELAAMPVDVLVSLGAPATSAAVRAAASTPVVFAMVGDPIESGFVASLAKPGGNVTGITNGAPEASRRLLDLVREAVPNARRVAVLWDPDNAGDLLGFKALEQMAPTRTMALHSFEVRTSQELTKAAQAIEAQRPDVLLVLDGRLRDALASWALKRRIPSASTLAGYVENGGLLSCTAHLDAAYRQVGVMVAKILGGSKPSDIAVESPSVLRFAINVKTAKVLGLTVPPSLLARADQVIE